MIRVSIKIIVENTDLNKIEQILNIKPTKIANKRNKCIWEYSIKKPVKNNDINDTLQDILTIINEKQEVISPFKDNMSIVIYINKEQYDYSFIIDSNIIKQIDKLKLPIEFELVSKGKI